MGLHLLGGKKVLVPREQRRIEPKEGDWSTLKKYLHGMLGDDQLEWYQGVVEDLAGWFLLIIKIRSGRS